ncbi:inosose dehydratase [Asanoa ishikariensis]|uniref:Inosose dehydratase n=1 Tax=Asanoa ishikariensis TaxID=137265 RepID=A0A1H3UQN8_9ACTN|nr:TIM barrel protein [Asanoa ishikariensis]GIF69118.1 inosose dehydratase [Asanoa ishikariensis]SDZ64195.1 inosose dehydratase [Asanoa ishikariensis]
MIRVAGAPISWGVCEVPGWGHMLPVERVLAEMAALGLTATELGPDGYLPVDRATVLRQHGLEVAGGFVPVVLHDSAHDPLPALQPTLQTWEGALVLAAATGADGYDARPELDADGWRTLLTNLDRINAAATRRGVLATLHPHVGTMVEREDEVRRVLDGSDVKLCLDTGHLLAGGTDPAALAREVPGRVAHVHLKDVDAAWAERVRAGEVSYTDAVRAGMYRPLGDGDVDVAAIVTTLTANGYAGWYVLEQDTMLDTDPPAGEGPVLDVRRSLEHLRKVSA